MTVRGSKSQLGLRRLLRRSACSRKPQPIQAYAVVYLIQSPRTSGIRKRHHFDVPTGTKGLRRLQRAESEDKKPTRNRYQPTRNRFITQLIFSINIFPFAVLSRTDRYPLRLSPKQNAAFPQSKYPPPNEPLAEFLILLNPKTHSQTTRNNSFYDFTSQKDTHYSAMKNKARKPHQHLPH